MALGACLVDIAHQVKYWREGALEEWQVSLDLLAKDRVRHALFFAHLALEKAIKALVCERTNDLAPRTHNLVRLAELADLRPSNEHLQVLAEMNGFCQAGRYPDVASPIPSAEQAQAHVAAAYGVFQWLMSRS